MNCTVEDIDFAEGDDITVTRLHLNHNGETETVELGAEDLCFMINACMTDSATLGDLHTPAPVPQQKQMCIRDRAYMSTAAAQLFDELTG